MAHEQDRVLTLLANLEGEVATGNSLIMHVSAVKLMFFSAGHLERAWNVAWNPTGTLLASCSADKTISSTS